LYGRDWARYRTKLEAGSHQEYNQAQYKDAKEVARRVEGLQDLFDRHELMKLQRVQIDQTWPKLVRYYPEQFKELFL